MIVSTIALAFTYRIYELECTMVHHQGLKTMYKIVDVPMGMDSHLKLFCVFIQDAHSVTLVKTYCGTDNTLCRRKQLLAHFDTTPNSQVCCGLEGSSEGRSEPFHADDSDLLVLYNVHY